MRHSTAFALAYKQRRNSKAQWIELIHAVNVWLYEGKIPPKTSNMWKTEAHWRAAVKQFRKMVEGTL